MSAVCYRCVGFLFIAHNFRTLRIADWIYSGQVILLFSTNYIKIYKKEYTFKNCLQPAMTTESKLPLVRERNLRTICAVSRSTAFWINLWPRRTYTIRLSMQSISCFFSNLSNRTTIVSTTYLGATPKRNYSIQSSAWK